ncbi:inactive heparanase-2 [Garra rufa]|uniref:inactive heparanase-2 n=1 Tax=Garra rufa TaxID=137080 RepID=UPI003CCE7111
MPRQFFCPVFGSSLWLALILQSLISSAATYRRPVSGGKRQSFLERTLILLDVNTRSPVKVLNDNFLSLQLDPSIIKDGWLDFLSSKRLVTLARGLSPAYLRFGGKRTDFLQFHNLKNLAKFRGPGPDYYLKNYEDDIVRSDFALDKQKGCKLASHPDMMLELQREKAAQMQQVLLKEQLSNIYSDVTLTARSLDKLYNFADCAGLHLIFGLNALHRNPDNSWNASSALSLLKYSAGKKYNISWELGNEPNSYRTMAARSVNSSRLAQDYSVLKTLLQSVRFYSRANLYGPNIGRPRKNAILLLDGFMKNGGSVVDAVTWQHYYIDRRVTKVEDFLKTRLLDTLSEQITKVLKTLDGKLLCVVLKLESWDLISNHAHGLFVDSLIYIERKNRSQDADFYRSAAWDYWLSLLFKRLVGPRVLAVHVAGLQRKPRPGRVIRDKLRIYAHCTSFHNHDYVRGSITIYIINLHRSRKKIKLAGTLRNKTVHQYLLQPFGTDGLHSTSVQLNGELLRMVDNETFPELKPRTLRAGRTIAMPPVSIGFYVIKNINAYACRR